MAPKKTKPTILAIDPGTRHLGLAVLDGDALVYHGVKTISTSLTPHDRLNAGRKVVLRLIRDFRPDVLAIEKAFFAKSRNTALLNVLVDEIQAVARKKGISVTAVAPSTVKRRVAGNGHATKRQVQRMIQMMLSLREVPEPPDVADALAVALCHLNAAAKPAALGRR